MATARGTTGTAAHARPRHDHAGRRERLRARLDLFADDGDRQPASEPGMSEDADPKPAFEPRTSEGLAAVGGRARADAPAAGRTSEGAAPVGGSARAVGSAAGEAPPFALVTDAANIRYLTGFTGSNGQLLLGPDEDTTVLITDHRYDGRAAREAGDLERVLDRDPIRVSLDRVAATATRRPRLVVEADDLTWAAARTLEDRAAAAGVAVVAATDLLGPLRVIKDDAEVARIAAACRITTDALAWLLDEVLAPGRTERSLAIALEHRFLELGADGVAFPSIVAAGANGALPHHEPSDRPLGTGDLVTIDCGALVDGYHADHTRTVALGRPPAPELVHVHEVVQAAQAAGRSAVRAGVQASAVDAAARAVIADAGYAEAFVHGTGHGVGLRIHEAPAVAKGSAATLAPGNVLTVEPGIYLPGLGGVRIEDTVVVTAERPARVLTDTPRELRIL